RTTMRTVVILLFLLSLVACQSQKDEEKPIAEIDPSIPQEQIKKNVTPAPTKQITAESTPATEEATIKQQTPPGPPITEDFQGKPMLSLFPRAGAFRPELEDKKGLQFWHTYIDHLMRTSGPFKTDEKSDNIAFSFRAIKGLDSVGMFSPLAVKPETTYEVRTTFSCDLTEGATAGLGLLEFDKFLWLGEQYPETLLKESQVGSQAGITLKGKVENQIKTLTFTTGTKTTMIHLVFFRDGAHDRNKVSIDDISIKEI
ncbi:MAG: hypothetical protein L3J63_05950, partial [Geopsychrobacter sp.]|nr:hypothetical protein [Geopsychrobacter sp.]